MRVLPEPRPIVLGELISHANQPVTSQFFAGKWSLVFFGFSHCPDICPTTLYELNRSLKQLPLNLSEQVQVTLVSVDPERDTASVLADYVSNFNRDFTAMTGEFDALKALATSVYVPFVKVANTGPHAEHMGGAGYQIDHGAQVVLINPDGNYHAFFKAPVKGDVVADQLPAIVAAF